MKSIGQGPVIVDIAGGVADVRLNRPAKLNALNREMFELLVATAEELSGTNMVRAVVVSGAGGAFSAGLDVAIFGHLAAEMAVDADDGATDSPMSLLGQRAATAWAEVPVPVIAAIDGVAFGAGLQVALGADIRVAGPGARLAAREISWGLIPDMGGTQILPELVGRDVAKELIFTGRSVVGEEAVQCGLATVFAVDPYSAAKRLATEIAAQSPSAVRHAKVLVDLAGRVERKEGLAAERQANRQLLADPQFIEALKIRQSLNDRVKRATPGMLS